MIKFKQKEAEDLMQVAIDRLQSENVDFKIIGPKEADKTSKINSKSMVLMEFIKSGGNYILTVKTKESYSYTKKFLTDQNYCHMKFVEESPTKRTITVSVDHLGKALDVIEVLGYKYCLSVVKK